jgi:dTDP-4-dehydrorhamnose reductase
MMAELINLNPPTVMHMTGPECLSRVDIACKIATAFNLSTKHVRTALLKDTNLVRPLFLCLNSSLAQKVLNYRIRFLDEILSMYA